MCKISDGIVFLFLLLCSICDIRTKKIPIRLLMAMSLMISVFILVQCNQGIEAMLGGALTGVLFCFISKWSKEAIGYGDSWIILLLGGYLGWKRVFLLLGAAFFFAGIFSLIGIVWKKWKRSYSIPFAPFLTIAYLGVMFL